MRANAKPAPPPSLESIRLQLATLATDVPKGDAWIFEPKLDGYRALSSLERGSVRLLSRSGTDWSDRFDAVRDALAALPLTSFVFDGEVCALDERGIPHFQGLQNARKGAAGRVVYFVFDVLFVEGVDVRDQALVARKAMLETIFEGQKEPLSFVRHVAGDGADLLRMAQKTGLEGVVAKRGDRPYLPGRTTDWLKIKCTKRQEMVIVGFTPPKSGSAAFGALLLAVNDEGRLRYAGKVGTGFSAAMLTQLRQRLRALEKGGAPVDGAPRMRDVTWVRPELVAEVAFSEWTEGGSLRHPSFVSLREDKRASEVRRERPRLA